MYKCDRDVRAQVVQVSFTRFFISFLLCVALYHPCITRFFISFLLCVARYYPCMFSACLFLLNPNECGFQAALLGRHVQERANGDPLRSRFIWMLPF